jgi:hypothetical protein
MKILRDNQKKLPLLTTQIEEALRAPSWEKAFRQIEHVKRMYLYSKPDVDLCIAVEFTFSPQIQKVINDISSRVENLVQIKPNRVYLADLTERNLELLVDTLEPLGFEIDEIIKNHHDVIKSWSEQLYRDQFLISNIEHKNFQRHITEDLGIATAIDENIITDRSMRYQYFTEIAKNHGETLTEVVANRSAAKVWVDKAQHQLTDVIGTLLNLKRLPLLVVFDNNDAEKMYQQLEDLANSLENNGVRSGVGIYFRLPNSTPTGIKFNKLIASMGYNSQLNEACAVVGVQSGKLPKFFLKNAWQPMSVITLDNRMGLRHGKIAVYANCCDLLIEYAEAPIMFDTRISIKWP